MKSRARDQRTRGQACVELAFVLPLLVLLLIGVYDFGCAIRANNTIANMSREGANLASRSSLLPQDIMNALAVTAQPLDMLRVNTVIDGGSYLLTEGRSQVPT